MVGRHEKRKIFEGGNIRGLTIMTGFTNSQKLSWMNNMIFGTRDIWLSLLPRIQGNWI
jgi:hypothetical protein